MRTPGPPRWTNRVVGSDLAQASLDAASANLTAATELNLVLGNTGTLASVMRGALTHARLHLTCRRLR